MPKKAKPMTTLDINRLREPGRYAVGGVDGLSIKVEKRNATAADDAPLSRYWVLRLSVGSTRRELGLGSYPSVKLEAAREAARVLKDQAKMGQDPKVNRDQAVLKQLDLNSRRRTFKQVSDEYFDTIKAGFRSQKHADQWTNTIKTYALKKIGQLYVHEIEVHHILAVLEPIWTSKTETANRLRGRIHTVLAYARVKGYREGDNPAEWEGNLSKALKRPRKVTPVKHHPALPVAELPRFMAALAERDGVGARALEFTILTAARVTEVRRAMASEFDLEKKMWTVPAERMKAKKQHRVPLCNRAIEILKETGALKNGGLVFVGKTKTGVLCENTQNEVIKDLHDYDVAIEGPGYLDPIRQRVATAHGMRSTFKDWAITSTSFSWEASELALAHSRKDKTEAAYARDDLFEMRAKLMDAWQSFCSPQPANEKVVSLSKTRSGT